MIYEEMSSGSRDPRANCLRSGLGNECFAKRFGYTWTFSESRDTISPIASEPEIWTSWFLDTELVVRKAMDLFVRATLPS